MYGMRINFILSYTNITSHAHALQHLAPSTYTLSGVLESCLLAEHLVNVIRGNCRNTTFNKLAQHYESVLAINQLNAQNLLL